MGRLLIVSNRLPVTVVKRDGRVHLAASVGGLATGMGSFYRERNALWIGWPGISQQRAKDDEESIRRDLLERDCVPVFLSHQSIDNYYYGFCNKTIWPLFHYFVQHVTYDKGLWENYKRVNKVFRDAVLEVAQPDDTIWLHDYHLMLLPEMLRKRLPDAKIGFFLHIPFPSYEILRLLPWRCEILEGLLGADLVGFHTYDYVRHFIDSVRSLTGHEFNLGQFHVGNRRVKVDAFPMGIDYNVFEQKGSTTQVKREIKRLRNRLGFRTIILSFDRLDYTKGIVERLEAFDLFLERYPQYRDNVTMVIGAVPSRTRMESIVTLKRRVDEMVGRINGKYGSVSWMPVWYLYRSLPFNMLVAFYQLADVCLVTPLRDGMNLVAKEFIASKPGGEGVLILSEMAGAAKELGEAVLVNPNNKEAIAEAMREALTMPEEEQIERNRRMQQQLKRCDVRQWASGKSVV